MSRKKISIARQILGGDDLAANLRAVLDYTGLTQSEFADALGIKPQAMNGYLMNRDNRKAINLYPKMVELGINGDWYLTGNGPMLVSKLEEPSPEDRHAMEIGKKFVALIKEAVETGTNSGILDWNSELGTRNSELGTRNSEPVSGDGTGVVIPEPRQVPGPSPDLTDEEYERLVELRSGGVRRVRR